MDEHRTQKKHKKGEYCKIIVILYFSWCSITFRYFFHWVPFLIKSYWRKKIVYVGGNVFLSETFNSGWGGICLSAVGPRTFYHTIHKNAPSYSFTSKKKSTKKRQKKIFEWKWILLHVKCRVKMCFFLQCFFQSQYLYRLFIMKWFSDYLITPTPPPLHFYQTPKQLLKIFVWPYFWWSSQFNDWCKIDDENSNWF